MYLRYCLLLPLFWWSGTPFRDIFLLLLLSCQLVQSSFEPTCSHSIVSLEDRIYHPSSPTPSAFSPLSPSSPCSSASPWTPLCQVIWSLGMSIPLKHPMQHQYQCQIDELLLGLFCRNILHQWWTLEAFWSTWSAHSAMVALMQSRRRRVLSIVFVFAYLPKKMSKIYRLKKSDIFGRFCVRIDIWWWLWRFWWSDATRLLEVNRSEGEGDPDRASANKMEKRQKDKNTKRQKYKIQNTKCKYKIQIAKKCQKSPIL